MEYTDHVVVSNDDPCTHSFIESDSRQTVLWLKGEHDAATVDELSALLAEAIALEPVEVIVDLSGVEFMAAAPVGALIGARYLLGQDARSLVLRDPSRSARLILELCGVDTTLTPARDPRDVIASAARALDSFVPVPATAPEFVPTPTPAASPNIRLGARSTAPIGEPVSRGR